MATDNFIKSEMLAEEFIQNVSIAREQLQKGKTQECLSLLMEVETCMQVALAMGERNDIDQGPLGVH